MDLSAFSLPCSSECVIAGQQLKRILVTGASGFVGQPLVAALAQAGYAVRAAVRRPMSFPNTTDVAVVPDYSHPFDWSPILSDIDVVIHLGGMVHADTIIPYEHFDRINRAASQELALAAVGAGVKRFIFISSIRAQSGPSSNHELSIIDEPQPTDSYGRSKLAAESAVRAAGVQFTIFRPVVIYGPGAKGNIATISRLASLPFPLPFGALTNRRSLLSIDNFISGILFALNNPATMGQTYVVSDPDPISIRDIFIAIREAHGRRPGLVPISPKIFERALTMLNRADIWDRLGGELVVDTTKLRSLGWQPVTDTYRGLAAMVHADFPRKSKIMPACKN
jgi:UDP-glucose 4-epimerase